MNGSKRLQMENIINYKLNSKIITFCTSGGSSLLPATKDLQETYPNALIENGGRL